MLRRLFLLKGTLAAKPLWWVFEHFYLLCESHTLCLLLGTTKPIVLRETIMWAACLEACPRECLYHRGWVFENKPKKNKGYQIPHVFCILIVLFGKSKITVFLYPFLLRFFGACLCVCVYSFLVFFLLPFVLLFFFLVFIKYRQFPFFTEMSEMSLLHLQCYSRVSAPASNCSPLLLTEQRALPTVVQDDNHNPSSSAFSNIIIVNSLKNINVYRCITILSYHIVPWTW